MKVTCDKSFEPISLTIKFETLEEAQIFYGLFNTSIVCAALRTLDFECGPLRNTLDAANSKMDTSDIPNTLTRVLRSNL